MRLIELISIIKIPGYQKLTDEAHPIGIIGVCDTYEAFFSYYHTSDRIQYGLIHSSKNLMYLVDNPNLIFESRIYPVNDFGIIQKKYADIDTKNDVRITTPDGGVVMFDKKSYFYCYKAIEIEKDHVIVNFGDNRNRELDEIEVVRLDPVLATYGISGMFEIFKLKEGVELLHSSIVNKEMLT